MISDIGIILCNPEHHSSEVAVRSLQFIEISVYIVKIVKSYRGTKNIFKKVAEKVQCITMFKGSYFPMIFGIAM